jgi:hypothetical protein
MMVFRDPAFVTTFTDYFHWNSSISITLEFISLKSLYSNQLPGDFERASSSAYIYLRQPHLSPVRMTAGQSPSSLQVPSTYCAIVNVNPIIVT